ncbi:MAG: hypothetical protein LBV19_07300 [Streptococcaceae bacterium]|nr:hypothetical protein [Streptococcaceae bacterium]
MSFIKRGMIYRSLGELKGYVFSSLLRYVVLIIPLVVLIVAIFALTQGSVSSVFVKGFALTFSVSALILFMLTILAFLIFTLVVKTNDISSILKNRYVNRFGSIVYLMSIILAICVFAQSVNSGITTFNLLSNYKQTLSSWQKVKEFVLPSFDSGIGSHADENHVIDRDYMLAQSQRELSFNQSINERDMIFASPSAFDLNQENAYVQLFSQEKYQ